MFKFGDEMRISRNGTPTTCNVTVFIRRNSLLAYGENCLFFLPILVGLTAYCSFGMNLQVGKLCTA